jgi:hypothetical protein
MKKKCNSCGIVKNLEDFYVHKKMADGHLNKCKDCVKTRVMKHRELNLEDIHKYDRVRGRTDSRKKKVRANYKNKYGIDPEWTQARKRDKEKWLAANRDKRSAHIKVGNAIRDGKLSRQQCEKCGKRAEAHHDDYSKPLEVRWLCKPHHLELHRKD